MIRPSRPLTPDESRALAATLRAARRKRVVTVPKKRGKPKWLP